MPNSSSRENVSFTGAFLAGASSGTCSTLMFQPLDVIKTRLQENSTSFVPQKKMGLVSTFTWLVKNEGPKSLWSGVVPSLWRCVPGVAIYFTSLEISKYVYFKHFEDLGPIPALTLGASSRCFTGVLLMPFTVVKTRFESGTYKYKTVLGALVTIKRTEGVSGLFNGLGATLARDVPFSALYFAAYTQMKKHTNQETMVSDFLRGIAAGVFASLVTHPADVIKTSLQLFPSQNRKSNLDAVRAIYYRRGVSGFFVGLLPRLVRRTMIAAMSWTVYEKVMRSFEFT